MLRIEHVRAEVPKDVCEMYRARDRVHCKTFRAIGTWQSEYRGDSIIIDVLVLVCSSTLPINY
jgi:hypothetical protein